MPKGVALAVNQPRWTRLATAAVEAGGADEAVSVSAPGGLWFRAGRHVLRIQPDGLAERALVARHLRHR